MVFIHVCKIIIAWLLIIIYYSFHSFTFIKHDNPQNEDGKNEADRDWLNSQNNKHERNARNTLETFDGLCSKKLFISIKETIYFHNKLWNIWFLRKETFDFHEKKLLPKRRNFWFLKRGKFRFIWNEAFNFQEKKLFISIIKKLQIYIKRNLEFT